MFISKHHRGRQGSAYFVFDVSILNFAAGTGAGPPAGEALLGLLIPAGGDCKQTKQSLRRRDRRKWERGTPFRPGDPGLKRGGVFREDGSPARPRGRARPPGIAGARGPGEHLESSRSFLTEGESGQASPTGHLGFWGWCPRLAPSPVPGVTVRPHYGAAQSSASHLPEASLSAGAKPNPLSRPAPGRGRLRSSPPPSRPTQRRAPAGRA